MKQSTSWLPKLLVILVLVGGAGTIIWTALAPEPGSGPAKPSGFVLPQLSPKALVGQREFNANCAQCHGANGLGSEKGPPLIHRIYNPGHHADESFYRAVANGVRRHHWNFGDMPAQPDVSAGQVADIIVYIREIQGANGILWEQHRM